jgi:iron(III) transport system ATP-binding protein
MAELTIDRLVKRFGGVTAVDHVSIHVQDGEFLTLLGPSGCGKSTTLAAIAGLDRPDEGRIAVGPTVYFDGASGTFLPPERRNCGLVFQSYALWPHMTVFDNCAFPLKLRKVAAARRKDRVHEALRLVEMEAYADRFPHQLSGGQQQRVALARTLVYEPTILLLDEPLSNLDAKLRERARSWLSQLTKRVGLTTVYVTHDQAEALALSDRIAVMRGGRVSQLGTPREIYEEPADPFVADFIGSSNFLKGKASAGGVALPSGRTLAVGNGHAPGTDVVVAVRPERLTLAAEAGTDAVEARIVDRSYLGARWLYHLELDGEAIRVEAADALPGSSAFIRIPPEACVVFATNAPPPAAGG